MAFQIYVIKINRSLFFTWNQYRVRNNTNIIVNFGPQHPAAHGVLRLVLQLNGEVITRLDPHIGLLHRGTERLIETKHYEQALPYFDRLDYVSMMTQEHAFCLAVERLAGTLFSNPYIGYLRILFDELTRVLNHFLAIACHALDIGSMSSIFWAFEEREKLMEFYERVSGARMHAAFHRPTATNYINVDIGLLGDINSFIKNCFITLNEMHNLLTFNKIWKQRLVNIGVLTPRVCAKYSLTGVLARSAGIKRDLRLSLYDVYSNYNLITLRSYLGVAGDCYDRYLLRMLEMGESLAICNSLITKISAYASTEARGFAVTSQAEPKFAEGAATYTSMEDLIQHFLR